MRVKSQFSYTSNNPELPASTQEATVKTGAASIQQTHAPHFTGRTTTTQQQQRNSNNEKRQQPINFKWKRLPTSATITNARTKKNVNNPTHYSTQCQRSTQSQRNNASSPLVVRRERQVVDEHPELRRAPLDLGEVLEGARAPGGAVAGGRVQEHYLAEPAVEHGRGDAGSPTVPRLEDCSHEATNSGA